MQTYNPKVESLCTKAVFNQSLISFLSSKTDKNVTFLGLIELCVTQDFNLKDKHSFKKLKLMYSKKWGG